MAQHSTAMAEHETHDHAHPGEREYINIAIFLAVITGIEVAIYYVEALDAILVPALIILSAIKFVTVVGYFMHLKFDDRRLAIIFGSAFVTAVAVFIAAWVLINTNAVDVFFGGV